PLRIGFAAGLCREFSALFTNRRVTPPVTARHVIEQYLALLEPLGVRPAAIEFPLPRDAAAEARVHAFFVGWGVEPRGRLVALLRRAAVVVGGDTGPLHLAAALGVQCVGLYGPTAAERNGPWGQVHGALQSPDGTLAGIGVEAVLARVVAALETAPASRPPQGVGSDMEDGAGSRLVSGHPPIAPAPRPPVQ